MAHSAITTTRVQFPTVTARRTRPAPTELETALAALKAHVRSIQQPYEPRFEAEAPHLEDWADHLDEVLAAAFAYARAVTSHIGDGASPRRRRVRGGRTHATSCQRLSQCRGGANPRHA